MSEQQSADVARNPNARVFDDFAHALEGLGAIAVTYNLVAHAFNSLFGALASGEGLALPLLFRYPSLLWGGRILLCCWIGFITYVVVRLVCRRTWVRQPLAIIVCWRRIIWINPWTWFGFIVCCIKWVCVWVLRWVCRWITVIITIPVLICILVVIFW